MRKRIIALVLGAALTLSAAAFLVSCGEEETAHVKSTAYSFVYDAGLGGLVVSLDRPQNLSYLSAVVIPETSYYWADSEGGEQTDHDEARAVVAVKENSFRSNVSLSEVVLPAYLKNIGDGAFYGCTSLEKVTAGSSLAEIGAGAFSGCEKLRSFEPSSDKAGRPAVTAVGADAFNSCLRLRTLSFDFGQGCTIGEKAFYYDANLPDLDLGNVSYVGSKAFAGYNSSRTLTLPSSTASWASDWRG